MIVRLVKLHFKKSEVQQFKQIFAASKDKIRAFPGVLHLELLQDQSDQSIFFTYSHWKSMKDLENYRKSELFKSTWSKTKPLFQSNAQAWTHERLHRLD